MKDAVSSKLLLSRLCVLYVACKHSICWKGKLCQLSDLKKISTAMFLCFLPQWQKISIQRIKINEFCSCFVEGFVKVKI